METVFIDLETTGLNQNSDKIVEIAIVDQNGKILMNTLVNPLRKIPFQTTQIHQITNDMVRNSPTLDDLEEELVQIFTGTRLIAYNINFDYSFLPNRVQQVIHSRACCMRRFALYNKKKHGNGKHSLKIATEHIEYKNQNAHRALDDTLACRAVWLYLNQTSF
ncbi:MAG: DNA polymerase-3 subunit epsilon [bacterium]|jgi:DNA polymerase-3 subunit epsilon